jgi:hypothetical protein
MRKTPLILAAALTVTGFAAQAQTPTETPQQLHAQTREHMQTNDAQQIYGSQLMTPAERAAYSQRLREARTVQARDRIRAEHHVQMQERAKAQGVTLPPAPPLERGKVHQSSRPGIGHGAGQGIKQRQGGGGGGRRGGG